jgi:uncharacterized membrane protein
MKAALTRPEGAAPSAPHSRAAHRRPPAGDGVSASPFRYDLGTVAAMSILKRILLWVMAAFYVFAGSVHFMRPELYLPMMPPYLPFHRLLIFLSGLAEVGLGIAVLVPVVRPLAAWGLILLLIAIFPANVHIALHNVPVFGATEGAGIWNWVRLPLQGVLILWAWWYTE